MWHEPTIWEQNVPQIHFKGPGPIGQELVEVLGHILAKHQETLGRDSWLRIIEEFWRQKQHCMPQQWVLQLGFVICIHQVDDTTCLTKNNRAVYSMFWVRKNWPDHTWALITTDFQPSASGSISLALPLIRRCPGKSTTCAGGTLSYQFCIDQDLIQKVLRKYGPLKEAWGSPWSKHWQVLWFQPISWN